MPKNGNTTNAGKRKHHKRDNTKRERRHKLPLDGLKVASKKVCRGRLTVGASVRPSQDGIYLKGLRSQFTERYALNDENSARRDEDLCRLIDCGLPKLRKPAAAVETATRRKSQTAARDEETEPGSSQLRLAEAASPGFRLPSLSLQHHFQHSASRNEVSPDLAYLLPSPPSATTGHSESIPSLLELFPNAESSTVSSRHRKRQRFAPSVHSTPIIPPNEICDTSHEYTIEDGYLNFQEQVDRVLHDVTNMLSQGRDLSDRQQLCEYYMRRLRSINE